MKQKLAYHIMETSSSAGEAPLCLACLCKELKKYGLNTESFVKRCDVNVGDKCANCACELTSEDPDE